jgi:hypothetical protein
MSGGYFDYKEFQLHYLELDLKELADISEDEEVRKKALTLSKKMAKLFKEVKQLDLYMSGETSEIHVDFRTKSRPVRPPPTCSICHLSLRPHEEFFGKCDHCRSELYYNHND